MSQKSQTALQKMQQIANRLISNTPELGKMLDGDSVLRPKKPTSPNSKKGKLNQSNGLSGGRGQMTANDFHDKCKDLTTQLQSAREKITSLEEQITIIKQRFVEREIQYRNIIQELQTELKSKSFLDANDRNRMTHINELHKEIIDNIGAIQSKTSKILIEQQSDIRRFFHKKIGEIKEKFKEDKINKSEKDQEYQQKQRQMASQLEWIKNIAHKIDQQNKLLMKKYNTLKGEFEIQERDRELLLKEMLMKKKQNAVLKSQVEQYEKLLNEVSKEMEEEEGKQARDSRVRLPELSRVTSQKLEGETSKRYETTIYHLNRVITKQKGRVRQLKNLYMREVGNKSQLQKIIRKLVQETRQAVIQNQKNRKRKGEAQRQQLLQKLLNNERILTLIYDKTFYSGNNGKGLSVDDLPLELRSILQDQGEGFH